MIAMPPFAASSTCRKKQSRLNISSNFARASSSVFPVATEVQSEVGGKLNPDWVEWLMGWPIGWTDLKPLAMDRFAKWPHSHGIPSSIELQSETEAA